MARYIAFDIGDRRIGVAVSDPFNSYALPSQTYVRTGFQRDIAALSAIIKEKGATHIVCGLPVNADGTPSEQVVGGILGLPADVTPLCLIAIGHGEATCEPHDEDDLRWENIHINQY